MLPSHDPVRVRAAHRRLAAGLGASAAVHVIAAALWLAAGPREAPEVPALTVYPPSFVLVDVSPEPDDAFGDPAPDDPAGGGGGAALPDEAPPAPPPPADDAPPIARSALATTAEAVSSDALSRTPVARPSAPPVAAARTAGVPGGPGPPTSGPPGPAGGAGSGPGSGPGGTGPGTGAGPGGTGGAGTAERFVERPERSPGGRTLGFPSYPPEARRAGVGGRARFRVLVNSAGDVVEAEVVERTLIDRRGRERDVDVLPYGLESVLMDGARQSKFRPARDRGENVRAYAFITLSAGVDG